jgi:hypothetical protein
MVGGKRQLYNHIIVRIGKKWPPKEVYVLQPRAAGEISQKTEGIIGNLARAFTAEESS